MNDQSSSSQSLGPISLNTRPEPSEFASIIRALDAIIGEDVLAQPSGEAFIRQGNRSLDEIGKRLQVDLTNIRSDGKCVPVNRPPLETCYMLLNNFRNEVVIIGTFAQYSHLIGQRREGRQVWSRLPHMYVSSDFALSEDFCQGISI